MAFGGAAVDPVGSITESDINTWWSSVTPADKSTWKSNFDYIMKTVAAGIPAGHEISHGPNADDSSYVLAISGSAINKSWT